MELQDYKYEKVETKNVEKDENISVSYLELFKYSTRFEKFLIFVAICLSLLAGVSMSLTSLVLGKATGAVVLYVYTLEINGTSQEVVEPAEETLMATMQWFGVSSAALGLIAFVGTYLSTVFLAYSALSQTFTIRKLYFSSILNQDISWYDQNQTGDFSSRIADDLIKLEEGLGEKLGVLIFYIGSIITSCIQGLVLGWELSLICVIPFPITMIAMSLVSFISSKLTQQGTDAYGEAGSIAEEVLTSIRTVVAFAGQAKEEERYENLLISAQNNNIKISFFNGASSGTMWFLYYSGFALSLWYGVMLVIRERGYPVDEVTYDAGNMITVLFSIMGAQYYFGMTAPYVETLGVAKGAAGKIFQVIDTKPVLNKSRGKGKKPKGIDGKITFEDVHFNYPSRKDVKVLNGFNLTVNSGETIALVGGSGCGKSTCIQLLQRFYDPDSGSIYIDDNKMTDLDLDWLRSHIGVVGQEPILFEGTISENIRLGYLNATQDEIEAAAKQANADSFITALPQRYLTVIGERGTQLSGGQKQRIAIARALVRKPAILLLDEATSALDTKSEVVVQAALDAATHGCTTVLVAHRLSTVRKADRIIVLADGQLQEEGSHESLMLAKGAYYKLVVAQCSETEKKGDGVIQVIEPDEREDNMQKSTDGVEGEVPSLQVDDLDCVEEVGSPETNSTLWMIMKYNSPEWWIIGIGCLASIIVGAMVPTYCIMFGDIVGVLAGQDMEEVRKQVNMYCAIILSIGIVCGLGTLAQYYSFGVAGEKLTVRLRNLMFKSNLRQEMGWFDEKGNEVGAICARLSSESASLQDATGQKMGLTLNSVASILGSMAVAYYLEWRLALLVSCFAPIIIVSIYFEQKMLQKESQGYYESLQKSAKIAVEAINGIRTVASLGCEHVFQDLYMKELYPYQSNAKRNIHYRGIVYGLSRSLMLFAYSAAYYYGVKLVIDGVVNYGDVFIVVECLLMSSASLGNTLTFTLNFSKGLIAASRILQLLNRTPKLVDGSQNCKEKWDPGNIHYKNVLFSYPSRPSVTVLKDLNLSVLKGQMVALVGPSGCGKSTIVQLFQRFYDPTSGLITIDEQGIEKMNLISLRSHMAVVSQEPNLFSKTIADNIAYGDNSRTVSREEIISAAKQANIHTFITSLPLGYETKLGEKGAQLSGGQKQRVAIARALVRNPEVLLLDEATSALDAESEKVVKEALDNAKVARTCIAIAHRLTTIQDANIICVINHGRIVEMGTHTELLNKRSFYYNLYTLQNYK